MRGEALESILLNDGALNKFGDECFKSLVHLNPDVKAFTTVVKAFTTVVKALRVQVPLQPHVVKNHFQGN